MSLCYYCGKEEETNSCPHCGISYCKDHLDPEAHKCMVYKKTRLSKDKASPSRKVPAKEKRARKKSGIQPKNRMLIAVSMIMISLSSIFLVSISSGGVQGVPGVAPPEVDYELHSVALDQVNVFRYRNDLPALEYDIADAAQDWAFRLARTGELKHNPDLPISMGENVACRTERNQDPKVALVLMVQEMVINDKQFDNANMANILGDYDRVSIGVAVEGDTVVLVLNFG